MPYLKEWAIWNIILVYQLQEQFIFETLYIFFGLVHNLRLLLQKVGTASVSTHTAHHTTKQPLFNEL